MGFLDGLVKKISDSNNKQQFVNQGLAFGKEKKWENALENFNKALEIDPNDVDQLINKGMCLRHLNRSEEALDAYNKAIQLKPSHPTAWRNQGMAFLSIKSYNESLNSLNKAINLGENDLDIQIHISVCLCKLGRIRESIQSINNMITKYPNFGSLFYVKGKILQSNGDMAEANLCFEKAEQLTKIEGYDLRTFKTQIDQFF